MPPAGSSPPSTADLVERHPRRTGVGRCRSPSGRKAPRGRGRRQSGLRAHGVTEVIELGAGKALTGMAKRIDKDLVASAAGTPDEIDALLKTL